MMQIYNFLFNNQWDTVSGQEIYLPLLLDIF